MLFYFEKSLRVVLVGAIALTALSGCGGGSGSGPTSSGSGSSNQVAPTMPITPDVPDLPFTMVNGAREFHLTAQVFKQKLSTFPFQAAEVWGYNGSTPGPTAIAYEGEKLRFVVKNELPEPTTVHFHGAHAPNDADGVAGISQLDPIAPGETYTYEFTPQHTGTFAYHAHYDGAVQELKGLDGFLLVLPRKEPVSKHVDRDYAMVLQQFFIPGEGEPVMPFPPDTGDFNTHTINGKTRDAASELPARVGEKVRIRIYNASNEFHSMHQHDFDMTVVSNNGHEVPAAGQFQITTKDDGPGNFFEAEFTPDKAGKWLFHCHVPHHTSNSKMSGPVGMARVFNVTQ